MSFQNDIGSSAREKFKFFEDNTPWVGPGISTAPIGVFVGGQYNSIAPTYAEGEPGVLQLTSEGRLKCDATLTVEGDIEIGAVELKDATTDTRGKVKTDGTDNALVIMQNSLPSLATGSNTIGDVTVSSMPVLTIGDVNVASLIPGTGATNLGKAEDAVHTSGDVGVMALSVRKDDVGVLAGADGDYAALITNEEGILRTQAQQHLHIEECSATTGWTVLGNDTTSLATTTNHIFGTVALEFDKVNGAANTKIAGIQKTLTSIDLTPYHKGGGFFLAKYYVSSISDVDYLLLRLGTDSTNYNEWQVSVDNLAIGWNSIRFPMSSPDVITGNGWNSAAITYVAIGVAFDAETDTLADIAVDHIATNTGLFTSADIAATITSEVSTPNINLLKVGNKVVNIGEGAAGTGTQRVAIANVAHDAADAGNPTKIGHKAVVFDGSAPPNAAAAENDRVNSIADEYGRQYVETTHPNYWDVSADYAGAQTNATIKAAPGAGLSLYITDMVISNGATAGNITLLDGSGGTVLVEIYPAINGGMSTNLRTPIKLTANTLLAITSTTVTTHSVTVSGFIAP